MVRVQTGCTIDLAPFLLDRLMSRINQYGCDGNPIYRLKIISRCLDDVLAVCNGCGHLKGECLLRWLRESFRINKVVLEFMRSPFSTKLPIFQEILIFFLQNSYFFKANFVLQNFPFFRQTSPIFHKMWQDCPIFYNIFGIFFFELSTTFPICPKNVQTHTCPFLQRDQHAFNASVTPFFTSLNRSSHEHRTLFSWKSIVDSIGLTFV